MTAEEIALREAFLAECWRPVPEWHPTKDEKADAAARNETLAERYGDDGTQLRVAS